MADGPRRNFPPRKPGKRRDDKLTPGIESRNFPISDSSNRSMKKLGNRTDSKVPSGNLADEVSKKEIPDPEANVKISKDVKKPNSEHIFKLSSRREENPSAKKSGGTTTVKKPVEKKIDGISKVGYYSVEVTRGLRKYGGPPPNWKGDRPGNGCQIFCGNIPNEFMEDELIPLFQRCGQIWELSIVMDHRNVYNKGFAFITYTKKEEAQRATEEIYDLEIQPGKRLNVEICLSSRRLFIGNIPKSKEKKEILQKFREVADNVKDVIIHKPLDTFQKNRGFCFVEFETEKDAAIAKRRIGTKRANIWGCKVFVDWAEPLEEPDPQIMQEVKVLYVKGVSPDCSEEMLEEAFQRFGPLNRVKKLKDYAFVHFDERDHAIAAMQEMNGQFIGGSFINVTLSIPPPDKKVKEDKLRARETRVKRLAKWKESGSGFSPPHPDSNKAPNFQGAPGPGIWPEMIVDYNPDYHGYVPANGFNILRNPLPDYYGYIPANRFDILDNPRQNHGNDFGTILSEFLRPFFSTAKLQPIGTKN